MATLKKFFASLSPKKTWLFFILPLVMMVIPHESRSFTITGNGGTGTLGLVLTTQQAIQLTVTGDTSGTGQTTTLTEPGGGGRSGDVNFGTVDTFASPVATGKRVRRATNDGARFVATLKATPTFTGFASAKIEIHRSDAPTSIPTGRVRWATGNTTDWSVLAAGQVMSENPAAKDVLAGAQGSGVGVVHEIAVEILDTDAAGAKTAVVTYTITGNP